VTGAVGTSNAAANLVVYEVLWADPFEIEDADIQCYLAEPGAVVSPATVTVIPTYAPFYSTASAGRPTPTTTDPTPTALPRFGPSTKSIMVTLGAYVAVTNVP